MITAHFKGGPWDGRTLAIPEAKLVLTAEANPPINALREPTGDPGMHQRTTHTAAYNLTASNVLSAQYEIDPETWPPPWNRAVNMGGERTIFDH